MDDQGCWSRSRSRVYKLGECESLPAFYIHFFLLYADQPWCHVSPRTVHFSTERPRKPINYYFLLKKQRNNSFFHPRGGCPQSAFARAIQTISSEMNFSNTYVQLLELLLQRLQSGFTLPSHVTELKNCWFRLGLCGVLSNCQQEVITRVIEDYFDYRAEQKRSKARLQARLNFQVNPSSKDPVTTARF